MLPNWDHDARGSLRSPHLSGGSERPDARMRIYGLNPMRKYRIRSNSQIAKNFRDLSIKCASLQCIFLWYLGCACGKQHFVWEVHETVDDPEVRRDCALYHPSDLFCWQCVCTSHFSFVGCQTGGQACFPHFTFYFLCQYCWLWGYRVFKGWATSRPYLNVRLKLFWKAPWSASFCVFHAPFGRNRRQRRETKKERDPYYLHFDVPSEM